MMNRLNLQLVAREHRITEGQFLVVMLNIVNFFALLVSTSNAVYGMLMFTSLVVLSGHFIVFPSTKNAGRLADLNLWIVGLTLAAGIVKLLLL
ncbi:hypothetical protein AYR62_09545 [Secundilactobacillus paracollinoides]|uniref:Uncharacterized protein n=1 Tax=Secundilactobacillus paracollinoides TaxID=240427 RepID=A0A1B2IYV2_9LACO|nr:hypothetical protein [Secundilactobacillus paracollinoides]ANZ61311.1 hypothetical protein AYR61_08080 [Secundilactobacillus paracollinoides]ANZ64298.1 hypothetical protein AYR62_09545 [Secundilactobacillus paracollinoides]ANZ67232.1 hypothetical protein AYR63_08830 [Secundilactobacillus paracollinoides]KRL75358.1 hypothetical protein FC17_GL002676 [Secundilactobacillus paracollinoides DSM 15502 = JCM 11969]